MYFPEKRENIKLWSIKTKTRYVEIKNFRTWQHLKNLEQKMYKKLYITFNIFFFEINLLQNSEIIVLVFK